MCLCKRDFIFIKSTSEYNTLYKVFYNEIIAFEAQRNYVLLHLRGRRIKTYLSISDVAQHFSTYSQFIRLHRAFIISIQFISQIKRGQITMENGLSFMFGDNYRAEYINLLNTYLLKRVQKEDNNQKRTNAY